MNSKKSILLFLIAFLMTLSMFACSSKIANSYEGIKRNQAGTLQWGGSPAVDGTGMLFVVDDTEYGAPGTPEDYPQFFGDDTYEVNVRADFKLTGKEAVRGWGATFPAIEFLRIKKIKS